MSLGGDGRAQATDRLPVDAHRPPHQPARAPASRPPRGGGSRSPGQGWQRRIV